MTDYRLLLLMVDFIRLLWIIVDACGSSLIICLFYIMVAYGGLSGIIVDCRGLKWIIVDFIGLL